LDLSDADVIVVDEPDDALGSAFADWAGPRGVRAVRCRLGDAARACSISIDGERIEVEPALPMLLRPLRGVVPPALADDRFLWGEQFAALWSAAVLTAQPVVNRPNEWGWASRATMSAVVTDRRAGREGTPAESLWHALPPGDGFRYHQDVVTWLTPDDPSDVVYGRSRSMPAMRGWDQVIVVGREAFRVTAEDVHDEHLEEESGRAVAELGLTFAAVSWGLPADHSPPILTKINPFPTVYDCLPVVDDVFAGLLRELST